MEYDELVHSKDIQILKSVLPFVDSRQQMPLAIIIQYIEFKNTIRLFGNEKNMLSANALECGTDRRTAMIQAIIKNISPEEQETMNNMMNIMNMMNMMNSMNTMENDELSEEFENPETPPIV